jgi:hypothetical protein
MNVDFGPIGFFGPICAVIIVARYFRYKERTQLYEAMRIAFEKGQAVPPEFISELQSRRRAPRAERMMEEGLADFPDRSHRDLRRGVVWLAIGMGFVGIGAASYAGLYYVGGAAETFASFAAIGAIPACIGLAFIGLWYFTRNTTRL